MGARHVSLATWEVVRHAVAGTPRGLVAAKNKGAIEMVFVERLAS